MGYVTDHAVLRYLERQCGLDVEAVRRHLSVNGIDAAAKFGCSTVILGDGARLRLSGDVAVTCLASKHHNRGKAKR